MKSFLKCLHPYIFATAPIFFFCSRNFNEFPLSEMMISMVVLLFTSILFVSLFKTFNSLIKASILTSIFMIIFFSYGPIADVVIATHLFNVLRVEKILLVGFSIVYFIIMLGIIKSKNTFKNVNSIFSIIAYSFFFSVSIQFLITHGSDFFFRIQNYSVSSSNQSAIMNGGKEYLNQNKNVRLKNNLPDVYYIILDMYPSNNVLRKYFNYDNSGFTEKLKENGFYIADKSTSNYPMTHLSLSSSLNFSYLEEPIAGISVDNISLYRKMLSTPKIIEIFRENGYKIYSFSTGWDLTETLAKKADYYLKYNLVPFTALYQSIIKMTMLRSLAFEMAEQQLYTYKKLNQLVEKRNDAPKFVFVHLYAPHPPFLFNKNGEKRNTFPDEDVDSKELLFEEIEFINSNILSFVQTIQNKNELNKPIVILQGDHGTGLPLRDLNDKNKMLVDEASEDFIQSRFGILNAYLAPEKIRDKLYQDITPVNTFRIICTELFDMDLKKLPNKNHFAWHGDKSSKFRDVTAMMKK